MADWHALYESWDDVPEETKQLIEQLFREKPKQKLVELFEREPYAKRVYEKAVGKWNPPPPKTPSPQEEIANRELPQSSEKNTLKNMAPAPAWNKGAVFLPLLTLTALLSTEIAYYSSQSLAFLDNSLPVNLKTWIILLSLAVALGLASSFYILKQPTQLQKLDHTSGGNSL